MAEIVAPVSWKEVGKGQCSPPQDGQIEVINASQESECQNECWQSNCDAFAFAGGVCSIVRAPQEVGDIELKDLGYLEGKTDGDGGFTCYRKLSCENFAPGTYHDAWSNGFGSQAKQFDVEVRDTCDLHFPYQGEAKVGFLLGTRLLVQNWHMGQFEPDHKQGSAVVRFSDHGLWFPGPRPAVDDDMW